MNDEKIPYIIAATCRKHFGERTSEGAVRKALEDALKSFPKSVGSQGHKVSRVYNVKNTVVIYCLAFCNEYKFCYCNKFVYNQVQIIEQNIINFLYPYY